MLEKIENQVLPKDSQEGFCSSPWAVGFLQESNEMLFCKKAGEKKGKRAIG